jgi:S-adenosylmethionine:tRNA ribosyltransferase-isomerase
MKDIEINDYDYDLPSERIAQYPVDERDMSQLLIYKSDKITKDIFRNLDNYLNSDSLLVFNNTRVIRARILFRKETGASIEVFCLEPLSPSEYELSFSSRDTVEWKCIVGNLKKWKNGLLSASYKYNGKEFVLTAERLQPIGEAWCIRFKWNCEKLSFGEIIEATGDIPLPPYINRDVEAEDFARYQTVYSRIKGSVAAPTAGLHFTNKVFENLDKKGIKSAQLTLHVGAGTFQPVKSRNISDHEMHCEHFFITRETIKLLLDYRGRIIPVGTTSVRTLESLYWLGVKLVQDPSGFDSELSLGQWESYHMVKDISVEESMEAILDYMTRSLLNFVQAATSIIIIPGYDFRMINGMVTNFHQPKSTLLLLVSAWTGDSWKKIYRYAMANNFRFLSYGDCSLLLK